MSHCVRREKRNETGQHVAIHALRVLLVISLSATINLPLFGQSQTENNSVTAEAGSSTESEPGQEAGRKTAENANENTEPQKTSQEQNLNDLFQKEMKGIDPERPGEDGVERVSWAAQLVKTIVVLGLMLGIFYGGYKVFIFKKGLPIAGSEVIQILYEYPISSGKKLQFLEMAGKLFILAISDAGVQLVTEINDHNSIDRLKHDISKESEREKPDFLLELSSAVRSKIDSVMHPDKHNSEQTEAAPRKQEKPDRNTKKDFSESSTDFLNGLRNASKDKLKNLRKQREFLRDNGFDSE